MIVGAGEADTETSAGLFQYMPDIYRILRACIAAACGPNTWRPGSNSSQRFQLSQRRRAC